jgi:hypothetical protein
MVENFSSNSQPERRRENRYNVEVDVVVFSGRDYFRTKTVNLSTAGCRLKDPIPEHFRSENLEIVLTGSGEGDKSFQMLRGSLADQTRTGLILKPTPITLPI